MGRFPETLGNLQSRVRHRCRFNIYSELLECAHEQPTNVILHADPDFTTRPLDTALKTFKSLAVVPVALGVLRSELAGMRQDSDEPFRTFATHVQGKAEACEFKTDFNGTCSNCSTTHAGQIYYTDEVVRDVLINGIADVDIRREALSADGMQKKPINEVIAFIESKETARNANSSSGVSTVSAYRRTHKRGLSTENSLQKSRPALQVLTEIGLQNVQIVGQCSTYLKKTPSVEHQTTGKMCILLEDSTR